jgi:hypothetical protein
MSLSGNLEDVSVADALQFIHLGGRTGTLTLDSNGRTAEIGFHQGRIVNAWGPDSKRLGDLLVDNGAIDRETLQKALAVQEAETPRRSLGQILVSMNSIGAETMYRAVEQQIERTVYDLVTWTQGTFQFALDDLKPIDDIAVFPGDVVRHLNLDTQMVLLDALRIFDERNRDQGKSAPPPVPTPVPKEPEPPSALPSADEIEDQLSQVGLVTERISAPPVHEEGLAGEAKDGEGSEQNNQLPFDSPDLARAMGELLGAADQTPHGLIAASARAGLLHGQDGEGPLVGTALQAGGPRAAGEPQVKPRLHVVTADRQLSEKLAQLLADEANVTRQTLREAGTPPPGEPPPAVLLDLRGGGVALEALEALRRARPRAALMAVVDNGVPMARVYETGVLVVVPGDLGVILSSFRSMMRSRTEQAAGNARSEKLNANFAKLRRIVGDLRSGLISTTISLSLMNIISESVERAVLFLVRRDGLVALGAFGNNPQGAALAQLTRGLRLPIDGKHALTEGLNDGQVRSMPFDDAKFPPTFSEVVGRPRSGQCAIFPVLGGQRVVAMVYADNGPSNRNIEEIEILELAAAQAGLAFENELLRRQSHP